MIVDLFCGVGGASVGMRAALGRSPGLAVDIDAEPLAIHAANFPNTRHLHADVASLDLAQIIGTPIEVLWASPPCPDFSRQNSGRRQDPTRRELAEVVIDWARLMRPSLICLENVPQFRLWGPYSPSTGRTAENYEGDSFRRFCLKLRQLGYMVEYRILRADEYGVPTVRNRLYLVAKFGGRDIRWPTPVPESARKTMLDVIDWSTFGRPAFERARALGAATVRRIEHGMANLVSDDCPGFIVPINNSGTVDEARPLNVPSLTLTAKPRGGCFAVVMVENGVPLFRMLTPRENYRLQGFPDTFIHDLMADGHQTSVVAAICGAGNSVCPPMAEQLVRLNVE